jgi:hypothetical protein
MDGLAKLIEIKQYMDVEDPETISPSLLPPLLAGDQELPSCHSATPKTKAKSGQPAHLPRHNAGRA